VRIEIDHDPSSGSDIDAGIRDMPCAWCRIVQPVSPPARNITGGQDHRTAIGAEHGHGRIDGSPESPTTHQARACQYPPRAWPSCVEPYTDHPRLDRIGAGRPPVEIGSNLFCESDRPKTVAPAVGQSRSGGADQTVDCRFWFPRIPLSSLDRGSASRSSPLRFVFRSRSFRSDRSIGVNIIDSCDSF
jgi:hypothetical protein